MRIILSLVIMLFVVGGVSAQVNTQKPNDFTAETNPNNANFEFYSQKNDSTRLATFSNVQKNMAPQVNWTAITYVPDSTGNASNLVEFVVTAGDSLYYIDGYGDALLLYNPADSVLVGSISGDTLYVNNLSLLLTPYRQSLDTAQMIGDSLYLSLSNDNVAASIVDLSAYDDAGVTAYGPLLGITSDSIYLASDTATTDLNFKTQAAASGRIRFLPLASTYQLAIHSDNNDVGMGSLANAISVTDTVINVTLLESGSNTGEMIITDSRTATTGITYAADYSAGFTARSIPDKGYVDKDDVETEVTSKVTATLYSILPCNTTSGAFGINVPAGPSAGDWFAISDSRGNANTNNITIEFTTAAVNFHGSSADYVMNVDYDFVRFTYVNATIGWVKTN